MGPCYLKHSRDNVSPGLTIYVSGSKLCVLPESEGKPDELNWASGKFLKLHGFLLENSRLLHVLLNIVQIHF